MIRLKKVIQWVSRIIVMSGVIIFSYSAEISPPDSTPLKKIPGLKSPNTAALLTTSISAVGGLCAALKFVNDFLGFDYHDPQFDNLGTNSLLVIFLSFGPSTGFYYAGDWKRGLKSAMIRLPLCAISAITYENLRKNLNSWEFPADRERLYLNNFLMLSSLGGVLISTIWDIATVTKSVDRHNAMVKDTFKINFIPTYDPLKKKIGIAFMGTF